MDDEVTGNFHRTSSRNRKVASKMVAALASSDNRSQAASALSRWVLEMMINAPKLTLLHGATYGHHIWLCNALYADSKVFTRSLLAKVVECELLMVPASELPYEGHDPVEVCFG